MTQASQNPGQRICLFVLSSLLLFPIGLGCQRDPGDPTANLATAEDDNQINKDLDGHAWMVATLAAINRRVPDENPFFGDLKYRELKAKLKKESESRNPAKISVTASIARQCLILGQEDEAIEYFKRALELIDGRYKRFESRNEWVQTRASINFWLGVAYLRKSETENCCQRNTIDSCIIPIQGLGIHEEQESARLAIEFFRESLRQARDDTRVFFADRWLLNIAYMAIGEYPQSVPDFDLINPKFFESDGSMPRLTNVARKLGVDTYGCAGGVAIDDFDNDGDLDLVVTDYDPNEQLRYFRNEGPAGFVDGTENANLKGLLGGLNINQADFNNDGHVDLFVMRGGWLRENGQHPNSLLMNMGDGSFRDITRHAGLAEKNLPTQTSSWGDYDLDGDLDLLIGNEPTTEFNLTQLYRNNGDETFTDVTRESRIDNRGMATGVIWGDFNGDRWPDCYISNMNLENCLYENQGDGTFRDVAVEMGVALPIASFPCWFGDYDCDGKLDLFVAAYSAKLADISLFADGEEPDLKLDKAVFPRLYRNVGDRFEDASSQAGIEIPSATMGVNFGDINNDGWFDFYLGTGWPAIEQLMPNLMFVGTAEQRFENRTMETRLGHLQKSHAVAFADFDQDGDQDLFVEMGGGSRGDRYFNALFENSQNDNNWVLLKLEGVESNRSAIGARIRIDIVDNGNDRSIYRYVNSGASAGANPLRQHIGIGRCDSIKRIEVYWPKSDTTQQFDDVAANQFLKITEGADDFEVLPYEKIQFESLLNSSGESQR